MILLYSLLRILPHASHRKVKIIYLEERVTSGAGTTRNRELLQAEGLYWSLSTIQGHLALSPGLPQLSFPRPCSWAGYNLLLE